MKSKFRIETVNTEEHYKGLRTLWCEVFGDEPSFVDSMYANFGDDITGYVAIDDEGRIGSALTCFLCGEFRGKPVYTSYAICTDPELRGLGLAGALVKRARDEVLEKGGISLISPAEPSLEMFYGAHGYVPFFFVDARDTGAGEDENEDEDFIFDAEDAEYKKADPGMELKPLSFAEYNIYREEFLKDIPHVKLNEHMLRLVQSESTMPDGESGLLLINGGDAICALNYVNATEDSIADGAREESAAISVAGASGTNGGGSLEIEELLVNPLLSSISSEIADEMARRLAAHFERDAIRFKTPGYAHCQSMAAGITESDIKENEAGGIPAYYGFPVQ